MCQVQSAKQTGIWSMAEVQYSGVLPNWYKGKVRSVFSLDLRDFVLHTAGTRPTEIMTSGTSAFSHYQRIPQELFRSAAAWLWKWDWKCWMTLSRVKKANKAKKTVYYHVQQVGTSPLRKTWQHVCYLKAFVTHLTYLSSVMRCSVLAFN